MDSLGLLVAWITGSHGWSAAWLMVLGCRWEGLPDLTSFNESGPPGSIDRTGLSPKRPIVSDSVHSMWPLGCDGQTALPPKSLHRFGLSSFDVAARID